MRPANLLLYGCIDCVCVGVVLVLCDRRKSDREETNVSVGVPSCHTRRRLASASRVSYLCPPRISPPCFDSLSFCLLFARVITYPPFNVSSLRATSSDKRLGGFVPMLSVHTLNLAEVAGSRGGCRRV